MTAHAKILVVDDDLTARLLMRAALQKTGFDVRLAVDGADALRQFSEDSFELVMLDVDMPGMSGIDVCAALRSQGGEHLPIVMVTGMDDVKSVEATYEAGATDFIAKPINWALIGHRANYLLRASHALSDLSEANMRSKLAEADLVRSQNNLASTLQAIPDLLFELGLDGRCYSMHFARTEWMVAPPAMLLGKLVSEVLPADAATICMAALQEANKNGFSRGRKFELKLENELNWFELSISRKTDVYPDGPRFVVLSRNITERKQAQEEILRLNASLEERVRQRTAQLQSANQELEAFSYSVSHDLRTPLSSIYGFSSLLGKEIGASAASERSKHCIARIHAGVVQMGKLIDAMLTLAQVSRSQLNWDNVDLSALAQTVLNGYRECEPGRLVEVDVQPALVVQGDPHLLRQVLENLLGNAWKFSSLQSRVRIAFSRETGPDGEAVYVVQDHGAGFDMAYSDKLFSAFQRLHDVTEFPGTGIGLVTVHRIIKRHGGRVWATSALGEGASFHFTLGQFHSNPP